MKKILILLPFLILLSCSVQKRKYQKGFYVNWKHPSQTDKTKDAAKANTPKPAVKTSVHITPAEQPQPVIAAAKSEKAITGLIPAKKPSLLKKDEPCDDLIFKDGTEIKAKITEISSTEIKYKKCDQADGPLYVARKSEVFMIKYANGTREVFKADTEPVRNQERRPVNPANQQMHPLSIVSFILSIIGLYPLIFTSIIALVLANSALRKIRERPDIYKGETLAQVAKTIAIIELCIYGAILLIFLIVILALL